MFPLRTAVTLFLQETREMGEAGNDTAKRGPRASVDRRPHSGEDAFDEGRILDARDHLKRPAATAAASISSVYTATDRPARRAR